MIRAAMVTKCYGVECFSFGGTGAFPSKVTDGAAFFGIVLTKYLRPGHFVSCPPTVPRTRSSKAAVPDTAPAASLWVNTAAIRRNLHRVHSSRTLSARPSLAGSLRVIQARWQRTNRGPEPDFRAGGSTSTAARLSTCYPLPSIEAVDLRLLTYIEQRCISLLRMDMGKDLVAASATPLVLAILAEGDSYGYAIIKRVTELSGGHLQWTDGMLYPVLHRLERQGHVVAKWSASENGRRRKYYRITREGRAQLAAQRQQWQAVDVTLRGIWMKACTA
jgi:PadR family transcriptional regulator PadR